MATVTKEAGFKIIEKDELKALIADIGAEN